jgi:hypothetical protein
MNGVTNSGKLCMLTLGTLFVMSVVSSGGQLETRGFTAVAESGLAQFLGKIPAGSESLYGFSSRDELLQVKLGTPIPVFTIVPDSTMGDIVTAKEYLTITDEWRIPITVDGEAKALLTLSKVNGTWKCVDFGAAGLAREIQKFIESHSFDETRQQLALLRLYQLHADFAMVRDTATSVNAAAFYPLRSASVMLERNRNPLERVYDLQKLLPVLKEDFRREVENEK